MESGQNPEHYIPIPNLRKYHSIFPGRFTPKNRFVNRRESVIQHLNPV
ncbi:hypothetical protein LEP1GSC047_1129 [Leptospira inadai serovar Lyme str. 10]|uniref:Uncharacterized protein n=1 Tax=Leptospira inadai serovar Lyme str. 10 TaxID=1049790 RepID=V6HGV0_9LEPT|nr:hypothetical protein LEP1GSC047_1129 [Leptospira inadai serovar Lyme str. 10]